jgi:hypothetical protein
MAAAANEREWKKEWNVWLVGKENSRLIGSAAVFFFRVCYSSVLACPFVEEWRRNLEPSPVFFSTLTTTNVERKNNLTFFSKYLNNLARTHGVVGPERNTRWPPRHDTFFLSSFKTFFRMRNDCGKNRPHQQEKMANATWTNVHVWMIRWTPGRDDNLFSTTLYLLWFIYLLLLHFSWKSYTN